MDIHVGVKNSIEFLADKNRRVHCDLPIKLDAIWVPYASIAKHYLLESRYQACNHTLGCNTHKKLA